MTTCPICASALPDGASSCERCGFATGAPSPWAAGPAAGPGANPAAPPPPPPAPYPPPAGQNPPASYGYSGYGVPSGPGTNGLAIASLSTSIGAAVLAVITCGLGVVIAPVGAVLGHVALSQIKRTGQGGQGAAMAGVIVGWALTALAVLGVVLVIVIGASGST